MSTPIDLPGMSYDDALVAYICAHIKAETGVVRDPRDVQDARVRHEDYYANEDTDWPERDWIEYRLIGADRWLSIDIDGSPQFLYDLLRVGLMTTFVEARTEDQP